MNHTEGLTLESFLKDTNSRLSMGNSWLCFLGANWIVYQRKYNAKTNILLYAGEDLAEALKALEKSQ